MSGSFWGRKRSLDGFSRGIPPVCVTVPFAPLAASRTTAQLPPAVRLTAHTTLYNISFIC
jgi:hypothetical protein